MSDGSVEATVHTAASSTARRLDWIENAGDALLYFHEHRQAATSPGRRLLAAVLADARACLSLGSLADSQTRADAVAWVKGTIESAPLCSFHEVCTILDLDEPRTREELLRSSRPLRTFDVQRRAR